jgi:hypothetical protein
MGLLLFSLIALSLGFRLFLLPEIQRIRRSEALHQRFKIECALCERAQRLRDYDAAAKHLAYMKVLNLAHKKTLKLP